jgi:hypothetical protein
MDGFWKWIGRANDLAGMVPIVAVGVAVIAAFVIGAELELRHASAIWIWGVVIGVFLVVAGSIRWLVASWRSRTDKVGGERFLSQKKIRLSDLVGQDSIIRDRTFEDCEINGPMVVMSTGQGVGGFHKCTWNGESDPVFIRAAEPRVGGVVGLEDCIFRRCRFFNVAIMHSPSATVPEWKTGFGITV